MLSEFQVKKLSHLFRILDFDHNGLLQRDDLECIADNISIFTGLVSNKSRDLLLRQESYRIWNIIKIYFRDEDLQYLNLKQWLEFLAVHLISPNSSVVDQNIQLIVDRIYEVFDKNNDSFISRLEFMGIFVSFRVEVRFADQCFRAIDSNQDGMISKQELLVATSEFFKSEQPEASGNFLFGDLESAHFATRKTFFPGVS